MPFKLTGYCRLMSKDGTNQAKKEKNAKFMALQHQMESSQQINKDKRDCRTFQLVKQLFTVGDT